MRGCGVRFVELGLWRRFVLLLLLGDDEMLTSVDEGIPGMTGRGVRGRDGVWEDRYRGCGGC